MKKFQILKIINDLSKAFNMPEGAHLDAEGAIRYYDYYIDNERYPDGYVLRIATDEDVELLNVIERLKGVKT